MGTRSLLLISGFLFIAATGENARATASCGHLAPEHPVVPTCQTAKQKPILPSESTIRRFVPNFDVQQAIAAFAARGIACGPNPYHADPNAKANADAAYDAATGLFCHGHLPGISSSGSDVGFIVPPQFVPSDHPDLVVHFHGLTRGKSTTLAQHMHNGFDYPGVMAESRRNAIMIVPFDLCRENAIAACHRNIDDPADFHALLDSVMTTLHDAKLAGTRVPGEIALAGHSAGMHAVANILAFSCPETPDPAATCYRSKITETHLLDAAYVSALTAAQRNALIAFAIDPAHRFTSVFTQATRDGNAVLRALINSKLVAQGRKPAGVSLKATPPPASPAFIDTRLDPSFHSYIVGQYSARLLRPACASLDANAAP